jgi:hypothetical protein
MLPGPHQPPKVSIVIPTSAASGRRAMLDRAIASVDAQDCPTEIVVVPNGAAVDAQTLRDLEADRRVTRVLRLDEANVSVARYAGLGVATGEYFGFLDDDDELLPGALSTRLALFGPDRDVVATNGYVVEAGRDEAILVPLNLAPNAALDLSFLEFNWFQSLASLFRTSTVPRNLFDMRLRYFEWSHLFFRLLEAGVRIHYDPSLNVPQARGPCVEHIAIARILLELYRVPARTPRIPPVAGCTPYDPAEVRAGPREPARARVAPRTSRRRVVGASALHRKWRLAAHNGNAVASPSSRVSRMTGIKASVVSSLRWTAMAKLCGQVVSWAITLVVIRLLAPGDYGLMAMVTVVIGLLAMVAEMGFGASLVQSATLDRDRVRDLFGVALVLNLLFMGALMAAAPLVARFYGEPRLTFVMQVACVQFALNGLAVVPDALLRRAMRFRALSLIEIGSGITGNLVTLALALDGRGVWSLVVGSLVVALARAILLQAVHPQREMPRFDWRNARGMVGFGAGVTTTRILSYFSGQADVLVGGRVLGRDALGIYSVALHLATLPMQRVTSIINDVAFAAFAKIQHDVRAVSQNLLLGIRLLALISFPRCGASSPSRRRSCASRSASGGPTRSCRCR